MNNKIPFKVESPKRFKKYPKKLASPDPRNNPFINITSLDNEKLRSLSPKSVKLPALRAISPVYTQNRDDAKRPYSFAFDPSRILSLKIINKEKVRISTKRTPTFKEI